MNIVKNINQISTLINLQNITVIGLCNAAMCRCMCKTSTKCQLPGFSFITYEYARQKLYKCGLCD